MLGLVILLAGIIFFLTPQGQAWAQDTFKFFTKVDRELNIEPTLTPTPTRTLRPTQYYIEAESERVILPTIPPSPPLIPKSTQKPILVGDDSTLDEEDRIIRDLTLEEVQALVDYKIYQPSWLPEDFSFTKASYDRENNIVTLQYYRLE